MRLKYSKALFCTANQLKLLSPMPLAEYNTPILVTLL